MGSMNSNERTLQSSFTGKRYEQIKEFMINIWRSKAKYKVLMARRAFNLNYAFMEACAVQNDERYIVDNIISNTALLLCAEEIAEYYRQSKQFPRILIADDLLLHGRGIIKLLNNFENLIVEFLSKKNIEEEKAVIHEKLFSAVNIYVFAQNKEGVLINQRYALKSEQYLPLNELRGLSQEISNALQVCGIANTSYVLSVDLPAYLSKKMYYDNDLADSSYLFRYRGNSMLYYYKYDKSLLKTIRASFPVDCSRNGEMLTGLVLFGDVLSADFDELCKRIAFRLSTVIPYSRIVEILHYSNKKLARPKAQLVSFLLSIECLVEFCREEISADSTELYSILLRSDYSKIASNFDKASEIKYEITELFRSICFMNKFKDDFSEVLSEYVQTMRGFEKESFPFLYSNGGWLHSAMESSKLYEQAEDIFYEVGINAECAAASYLQGYKKFDPDSPGSDAIRLNQYLSIMNHRDVDSVTSIGCILGLMDSGLLSMNLERNQETIECVLKAGELATYVLPRRFSVFIPAFAIVERYFQKRKVDLKVAISSFIDYLQDHCYKQGESIRRDDREQLKKLKESKGILLYMYMAGQLFQDWDTELLTVGDRIASIEEQYGIYRPVQYQEEIRDEFLRKRHYAFCARLFIHSDE